MEKVPGPCDVDDTVPSVEVEALTPAETIALIQAFFIDQVPEMGVNQQGVASEEWRILERAEGKLKRALAQAGVPYDDSVGD